MVVDTVEDADQQVVVLALLRAEASGKNFIYRIGPSFVRARTGQRATPPADAQRLREIFARRTADSEETRPATKHGLIAVGSHVGLTTRQLDRLRDRGKIIELELDVPTCSTTALVSSTSTTSQGRLRGRCRAMTPRATS